MSRIGSYGASQLYLYRLSTIQERMNTTQVQVSTELKSTSYSGIASDANRVINLENEKNRADAFVRDNALADTRLKATNVSLDAMETSLNNFKKRLDDYASGMTTDQQSVQQLQQWAFETMKDLQSYLAASVDGQYIFSGGRVSDEPVKLPADTLAGFQQIFNGTSVQYPTTRAAALADVHLGATDTGALTIDTANGTITAATDAFDKLVPGTRVTLGGVTPPTSFTIKSVDATTNSIKVSTLTSETSATAVLHFKQGDNTFNMSPALSGGLTFSPQGDTITAGIAGALNLPDLAVGKTFSITNSTNNNGNYEIVSNDGTTITVKSTKLDFAQPTTTEAAATLTTGSGGTYVAGNYGTLSFSSNASGQLTVTASTAGSLANLANEFSAGDTFTISGSTASGNDGTYKVVSNNGGTSLTVTRVDGGSYTMPTSAGVTLDADSWYRGDNIQLQHSIDTDRTVDLGIYASDPAFEKAFRALGLIAQGTYGTGGGLENNLDRVNQARTLLQDSIARNGNGIGPFGQEQSGDLQGLQAKVGTTQNLIKTKNDKHTSYANFLLTRITDLEQVDKTEAVARLLDDQTALQASYQALATVRGLSLLNYMK